MYKQIIMSMIKAALLMLVTGAAIVAHAQESSVNVSDQQVSGAYEVVPGWPKPMSTWPGHEGWTWGSTQGIFAQNPDRIFILQRGELRALNPLSPVMQQIEEPSEVIEVEGTHGAVRLSAPVKGLFQRNASVDPLGSPGEPDVPFDGVLGEDYRWEHLVYVVNGEGEIIEEWTQWDQTLVRPHKVRISPYDPEKRVWIVDDGASAIFVFSNDGKELLQTIGTPGERGADSTHFSRQTDIAWLPDGTFFVSDGYTGTRVVKFDKDGNYLMEWGEKGTPPNEKRPNYFNTVHGIAIDDQRRVYVVDRTNRRIQIFDENGQFLNQWYLGDVGATYDILITADQHLWMSDGHENYKIYKYDLNGKMLYHWGGFGTFPGQLWGVHQMSVDQEGNLYVAEVWAGRAQKFRPRQGANPDFLIGKSAYSAWQE
ncbi:MAG: hypothetical protein HOM55_02095 [Proteobacteria bacterium]|jgi:hypothetical protein|nr:hypothetical protein [Pseudomonadota bacterium]